MLFPIPRTCFHLKLKAIYFPEKEGNKITVVRKGNVSWHSKFRSIRLVTGKPNCTVSDHLLIATKSEFQQLRRKNPMKHCWLPAFCPFPTVLLCPLTFYSVDTSF